MPEDFIQKPEDKGVSVPVPAIDNNDRPAGRRDVGKHVKKHSPVKRIKAVFRKARKARPSLSLRRFAKDHEDGVAWLKSKSTN